MSAPLPDYKGQVGICPTCGKAAEICVITSVEEPDKRTFQWVCWHPEEDGKPRADVMAVLYELGENKYKFWTAEGFFLLHKEISELSAEHGIDVRKYSKGETFDFDKWWEEFVSHESMETLERYLDMPQDRPIFKAMKEAVVGELEVRR